MCRAVNPKCEPADNDETSCCSFKSKLAGNLPPIAICAPGSNDCDPLLAKQLWVAKNVQYGWRLRVVKKPLGPDEIAAMPTGNCDVQLPCTLKAFLLVKPSQPAA
jgi:hypothetical protein